MSIFSAWITCFEETLRTLLSRSSVIALKSFSPSCLASSTNFGPYVRDLETFCLLRRASSSWREKIRLLIYHRVSACLWLWFKSYAHKLQKEKITFKRCIWCWSATTSPEASSFTTACWNNKIIEKKNQKKKKKKKKKRNK